MRNLAEIVQIRNPRSKRYVVVDRVNGVIVKTKKTAGPYKNIQVLGYKKNNHAILKESKVQAQPAEVAKVV
jgi:hypothetical protein